MFTEQLLPQGALGRPLITVVPSAVAQAEKWFRPAAAACP